MKEIYDIIHKIDKAAKNVDYGLHTLLTGLAVKDDNILQAGINAVRTGNMVMLNESQDALDILRKLVNSEKEEVTPDTAVTIKELLEEEGEENWCVSLLRELDEDPWGFLTSKPFKDKVKALRIRDGLTQAQLASNMGVTTTAVWDKESHNRKTHQKTLERYADYFGVPLEVLRDY